MQSKTILITHTPSPYIRGRIPPAFLPSEIHLKHYSSLLLASSSALSQL